MTEIHREVPDDEVILAFTSRGYAPEDCWIVCDMAIRPLPDGSGGRPLLETHVPGLDHACVGYLRKIGRPDVPFKGAAFIAGEDDE